MKKKRIIPPCGGDHDSTEVGRCAKCEVLRLTTLCEAQEELIKKYRGMYEVYEWAFRQALRLIRKGIPLSRVELFLDRVEEKPTTDPSYFDGVENA